VIVLCLIINQCVCVSGNSPSRSSYTLHRRFFAVITLCLVTLT
jgi:hypothetical protein